MRAAVAIEEEEPPLSRIVTAGAAARGQDRPAFGGCAPGGSNRRRTAAGRGGPTLRRRGDEDTDRGTATRPRHFPPARFAPTLTDASSLRWRVAGHSMLFFDEETS